MIYSEILKRELLDSSRFNVVLSIKAFEMMQHIFTGALKNVLRLRLKVIILIKPIGEIWPLWGLILRLWVCRQFNCPCCLNADATKLGCEVDEAELGNAVNLLNPTVLVVVEMDC